MTDYDGTDWRREALDNFDDIGELEIKPFWKDTLMTGVMLGTFLGAGLTLIVLAITGVLVTVCGS